MIQSDLAALVRGLRSVAPSLQATLVDKSQVKAICKHDTGIGCLTTGSACSLTDFVLAGLLWTTARCSCDQYQEVCQTELKSVHMSPGMMYWWRTSQPKANT